MDWARVGQALTASLVPHDIPNAPGLLAGNPADMSYFEMWTLAYGETKPVLHRFAFSVASGKRVDLVGRSGSGKAALLELMQRQYHSTSDHIKIESVDIAGQRSLKVGKED